MIRFAYTRNGRSPVLNQKLVGINQTIFNEDLLAITTNPTFAIGTPPNPAIRKLLAADKTANYGAASVAAAPSAPTLATATTGGSIAAAQSFYGVVTYVSAAGETVASAVSLVVTTGAGNTNVITCPSPGATANAVGWKLYLTQPGAPNTGPFYLASNVLPIGTNATVTINPTTAAATPPATNTTGKVAGIAGVARYTGTTAALGQFTGGPTLGFGGGNYQFQSMGQGVPPDPLSGQSLIQYYAATPQNVFLGALDPTSAPATHALDNTLAGIIMTPGQLSGGAAITNYTLDTNATALQQVARLIEPDAGSTFYGKTGGPMFFEFLEAFDQNLLGVNYQGA